jgi:tetratricopeptide (TPR) repeat protein
LSIASLAVRGAPCGGTPVGGTFVAKVSELKERARALEQQGEGAKALAIYEHILKHLEGTPALERELPLYVKVGDLALKLGDPAKAIAMYEQALEHYRRGSRHLSPWRSSLLLLPRRRRSHSSRCPPRTRCGATHRGRSSRPNRWRPSAVAIPRRTSAYPCCPRIRHRRRLLRATSL